jgi:hypothetical protein
MDREPHRDSSSKRFRWVERPSEEELLGLSSPRLRHQRVSFLPQAAPEVPARPEPQSPPDPHRPVRVRDVVTVFAVLTAAWVALHQAQGRLPLRQAHPAPTTTVAEVGSTQVSFDRRELASLPRQRDRGRTDAGATTSRQGGGSKDGSGSGSKDDSKDGQNNPPPDEENPPLLEATVPGVGSVTVEQPDVQLPIETPTVPDMGAELPLTRTLPEALTLP